MMRYFKYLVHEIVDIVHWTGLFIDGLESRLFTFQHLALMEIIHEHMVQAKIIDVRFVDK